MSFFFSSLLEEKKLFSPSLSFSTLSFKRHRFIYFSLTRVDAVGHRHIDQAVRAADRHGRLGALLRQRVEARARAAAEDDGEHRRRGRAGGDGSRAAGGDGRALDDGAGDGGGAAAAGDFVFLWGSKERKREGKEGEGWWGSERKGTRQSRRRPRGRRFFFPFFFRPASRFIALPSVISLRARFSICHGPHSGSALALSAEDAKARGQLVETQEEGTDGETRMRVAS